MTLAAGCTCTVGIAGQPCPIHGLTLDTPKPPAPSPASAETLEQLIERLRGSRAVMGENRGTPTSLAIITWEDAQLCADALRRLQSTEQERDARAAEVEHWVMRYNELEKWRIQTRQRAEAAEQRLQSTEQERDDWGGRLQIMTQRALRAEKRVEALEREKALNTGRFRRTQEQRTR